MVFLGGLFLRVLLGFLIYSFNLEPYFGPDAFTYNRWGKSISDCWWLGLQCPEVNPQNAGMIYFTSIFYIFTGSNPLVVQFASSILGAATPVLVYFLALDVFSNKRVARYSALLVAFLPAMIIWSSQLLKDGIIVFMLVLIIATVVRLQKRFNFPDLLILVLGLMSISVFRFYIFYSLIVAAVGAFLLGPKVSADGIIKRFAIVSVIAATILILGVQRTQDQFDSITLERIQQVRDAQSNEAFANTALDYDFDVSTPAGALAALPVGILTILFAPFPWQLRSVVQLMTLPEILVWWAMFPFMFLGLKYILKHKFRESVSILLFTTVLLLAYSIYQGNVGTIYRQRTQIQVFLLIFAAVGWVVRQEQKENAMPLKPTLKGKRSLQ